MSSGEIAVACTISDNPDRESDFLLRLTLRSLERYGRNFGRVFMLGKRRDWFTRKIEMVDVRGSHHKGHSEWREKNWRFWVFCHTGLPFVAIDEGTILVKRMDFANKLWIMSGQYESVYKKANNVNKARMELMRDECGLNNRSKFFDEDLPMTIDVPGLMTKTGLNQENNHMYSFRQLYAKNRMLKNERHKSITQSRTVSEKMDLDGWRELIKKERKKGQGLGIIKVKKEAINEDFEIIAAQIFSEESRFEKSWIERELGENVY